MMNALTIGSATPGNSASARRSSAGRDLQNLGLLGFHPGAGQGRGALEHCDVADEIALTRRAEDLLRLLALFENLDLAAAG